MKGIVAETPVLYPTARRLTTTEPERIAAEGNAASVFFIKYRVPPPCLWQRSAESVYTPGMD
ncbi:MAG TPA: hypothetical protein VF666_00890 [Pyrinomonadaceae bacterium]